MFHTQDTKSRLAIIYGQEGPIDWRGRKKMIENKNSVDMSCISMRHSVYSTCQNNDSTQ